MNALLLLDFQHDFSAFGALSAPAAPSVLARALDLIQQQQFDLLVTSQNWLPATHPIFAANHYFRYPKQVVTIEGKEQRLWPMYGIQESFGADWMEGFPVEQIDVVVQKGLVPSVEPYSCFSPACSLDLHAYLQQKNITELVLGGFLLEFSVLQTALDALELGYNVSVVKSLCAAANLDGSEDEARAFDQLAAAGVLLVD